MPIASHNHTSLSLGETDRRDSWWVGPIVTAAMLGLFVVYATFAGLANAHYFVDPYLSPFYSPNLKQAWMPAWLSPAVLILAAPAGFRATCYYYRKAYYRAFFFDPMGCAVGEGRHTGYKGERAFPFILQNLHRFFLYLAIILTVILWKDAIEAFIFPTPAGHRFGMGIGSLIMVANVALITAYTLGCHSLRHLIGGKIDAYSCTALGQERHQAWSLVTWFNKRHMQFAWASLISILVTDIYIRLLSTGLLNFHMVSWHPDFIFFTF